MQFYLFNNSAYVIYSVRVWYESHSNGNMEFEKIFLV